MSGPTLIIDGDIIAYKAAASVERSFNWGEGLWTLHSYEAEGITSMESQIATLMERLKGGECIFALSDGASFRYDIYPQYKSNRKATRKPLILPQLKEHLLENYRTYLRPRLEGDDILGILMTSKTIVPGDKIQVSIDKDQRCIPGKFYDQGRKVFYDITDAEAHRWHMYQTLIGDATDGYPGCPGVGPVVANAALDGFLGVQSVPKIISRGPRKGEVTSELVEVQMDTLWEVVVSHFKARGFTYEDALCQARVAKILTNRDYDFDKKRPILWDPPR